MKSFDPSTCPRRLARRQFLGGAVAGAAVAVPIGVAGWQFVQGPRSAPVSSPQRPNVDSKYAMPGLYPGRVIRVENPQAVAAQTRKIDRAIVAQMMDRGMCALTGADHPVEAWRKFFDADDVVGIKVNPVGYDPNPLKASISNPEVILETVRGLKSAGVRAKNILLFERYANEFVRSGYEKLLRERELEGVRWWCASTGYSDTQLEISGLENRSAYSPELLRHVVGYDPDVYVSMGFAQPGTDPKDDRRLRSHVTTIVTRMVSKFIAIPVLKDHRSSGVTLALKNMSHGLNNNVARSHITSIVHGYTDSLRTEYVGPNQCNTFIPTAVNQRPIIEKAVLQILDGLIAVYEGGPGTWNRTWGTWLANSLFFATDPVALDLVGRDIIDAKRQEVGLPATGKIGRQHYTPAHQVRMALSPLGASHAAPMMTLNAAESFLRSGGYTEVFDRRTPEHIELAGTIGLGVFDKRKIDYRQLKLA